MPTANITDSGLGKGDMLMHSKNSKRDKCVPYYTFEDIDSRVSSGSSEEVMVTNLEMKDVWETDPFFALSQFQSLMFATILEDVITSFRILNECNNHIRVLRVYDDMQLHLDDKYNVAKPAILPDELDAVDPKQLNRNEYKMYKLERDRDETAKTMELILKGLALSHSFRPLWNYCRDITEQQQYREYLKIEAAKNRILARTLHRQLRQQRVQHMTSEYECECQQDNLKKQIEDREQMAAIQERYTMKWQTARTEQLNEVIGQKEGQYANSIEYYKRRAEHESLVHGEIEMLTSIFIHEKLQQIEETMEKYETDIEKMDLKIQTEMSEVHKITDQNQKMSELFKSRAKEIKDWVKFKEDRAKAQKYHNDMTRSAVIVQAWWRGLLVRKQLGPYRPGKKPKAAKKKK